jgi:hypothetical protein
MLQELRDLGISVEINGDDLNLEGPISGELLERAKENKGLILEQLQTEELVMVQLPTRKESYAEFDAMPALSRAYIIREYERDKDTPNAPQSPQEYFHQAKVQVLRELAGLVT